MSTADSIKHSIVEKSGLNDEYRVLKKMLIPANREYETLYLALANINDEQRKEGLDKQIIEKMNQNRLKRKDLGLLFVKQHPNSLVSLKALEEAAGIIPDAEKTLATFNSLSESVKDSPSGKQYAIYLRLLSSTAIGSIAPEFSQADSSGKIISLSSFRGKYLLIDFWASWCGPCRGENPNLVKNYDTYHPKGLEILGVSLDRREDRTAWLKAIASDGLMWPQVSDLKYWKNEAATLYGVRAIPQNFLLDPQGRIIAKNIRAENLSKKLAEIFGTK